MSLSRRALLRLGTVSAVAALPGAKALAQLQSPQGGAEAAATEGGASARAVERHGISFFGDLKYPPDFRNFDYVNPAAPKGGPFSMAPRSTYYNQADGTFDTFNPYNQRGNGAQGLELIYDTLMVAAGDEKSGMYGRLASSVIISGDGLTYRFKLRPEARFHDGAPLTSADVVASFEAYKAEGYETIRMALRDLESVEADGPGAVMLRFRPGRARDVPLTAAGLPIFSRAHLAKHPFGQSSLEMPLGSGPYKLDRFEQGRFLEYRRVADYWGRDLPSMKGRYNFDTVRYEYFRERVPGLEAFKAKIYLFREEFTAREWATQYDFPAVREGKVKVETLPDESFSGVQGWFFNTRRPKFFDRRVREAIGLLFDFDWTNRNLMYDSYRRTVSFFQNSEMMATGKPSPAELKLLDPFRDRVPEEVFDEPYVPPATDGSGEDRNLRRQALELLKDAGYSIQKGRLVDPSGAPFTVEFLDYQSAIERHTSRFIAHLKKVGIEGSFRLVDAAQYQMRLQSFDFDIVIKRYGFAPYPGDELRAYFSTEAARTRGSYNLAGIADPVVDHLINTALAAPDAESLIVTCRALDRVLRAGRYWVPQWYLGLNRIAYWDQFDRPAVKPKYDLGVIDTWWSKLAEPQRGG
ncbi:extracellular solute-binding protein [Xanthobacter autotrophicus DSM 431]|uniref:extracellular solute-binding protein n=1 Tax=Xanthobacter nonsaccharivorans TaxID=3119912 RepID=UPI003726744A